MSALAWGVTFEIDDRHGELAMRMGDKMLVGLVGTVAFAVCGVMMATSVADRRLAATLERFNELKAAMPSSTTGLGVEGTDGGHEIDISDRERKIDGAPQWDTVFEHMRNWLDSISYRSRFLEFPAEARANLDASDEFPPFPAMPDSPVTAIRYVSLDEIPPLPPAPDDLIAEIRAAAGAELGPRHLLVTNCIVLLAARAMQELESNDDATAVTDIVLGMRIADTMSQEDAIRVLCDRLHIYDELQNVIQDTEITLESARPLLDQLTKAKGRVDLRSLIVSSLDDRISYVEDWKSRCYADCVNKRGYYWGTRDWLWVSPVCRPLFDQDQQRYVDVTMRLVDLAGKPVYETKAALQQLEAESISRSGSYWNQNEAYFVQERFYAIVLNAHVESRFDVMRLGIALNAYCGREGKPPETLEAVYGDIGGAAPKDSFTGAPYHYEVYADGFKVYSEGWKNNGSGAAWAHGIGNARRSAGGAAAEYSRPPVCADPCLDACVRGYFSTQGFAVDVGGTGGIGKTALL